MRAQPNPRSLVWPPQNQAPSACLAAKIACTMNQDVELVTLRHAWFKFRTGWKLKTTATAHIHNQQFQLQHPAQFNDTRPPLNWHSVRASRAVPTEPDTQRWSYDPDKQQWVIWALQQAGLPLRCDDDTIDLRSFRRDNWPGWSIVVRVGTRQADDGQRHLYVQSYGYHRHLDDILRKGMPWHFKVGDGWVPPEVGLHVRDPKLGYYLFQLEPSWDLVINLLRQTGYTLRVEVMPVVREIGDLREELHRADTGLQAARQQLEQEQQRHQRELAELRARLAALEQQQQGGARGTAAQPQAAQGFQTPPATRPHFKSALPHQAARNQRRVLVGSAQSDVATSPPVSLRPASGSQPVFTSPDTQTPAHPPQPGPAGAGTTSRQLTVPLFPELPSLRDMLPGDEQQEHESSSSGGVVSSQRMRLEVLMQLGLRRVDTQLSSD